MCALLVSVSVAISPNAPVGAQDLTRDLDTLRRHGGNYVRNTMSDRDETGDVYAFKQLDSGKYDLQQWNERYFDRLRHFLEQTAQRDIIVQIELWDAYDLEGGRPYQNLPWNPKNNVNYTAANTLLPATYPENRDPAHYPFFRTVSSLADASVVRAYQAAFIEKVLSVTLPYDHVLYTTMNESRAPHEWSRYWADVLRAHATDANRSISIAPMRNEESATVDEALRDPDRYDFADISQTAHRANQAHADIIMQLWSEVATRPMPLNSTKQYGGYKTLSWSEEHEDEGIARLWRPLLLGQASARHHRPEVGLGQAPEALGNVQALRTIMEAVRPWDAHPHQKVDTLLAGREADEAYLMADPGRVYALYFPGDRFPDNDERVFGDGTVQLDVSALEDPVRIRWYRGLDNDWKRTVVKDQDPLTLERPDRDHWAVLIEPE